MVGKNLGECFATVHTCCVGGAHMDLAVLVGAYDVAILWLNGRSKFNFCCIGVLVEVY